MELSLAFFKPDKTSRNFALLFLSISASTSSSTCCLPRSSSSPGGLSVGRLENAGRCHEVLYVLPENLVLGAQAQVLLLDIINARRKVIERVLELEHLRDQSSLLLLLLRCKVVPIE